MYARPIEKHSDAELLARLRRRIRPLVKRRTEQQVATDLPPEQEQLRSLTLLRQLSLHPGLVEPEHGHLSSSKIETLVDQLTDVVDGGAPGAGLQLARRSGFRT